MCDNQFSMLIWNSYNVYAHSIKYDAVMGIKHEYDDPNPWINTLWLKYAQEETKQNQTRSWQKVIHEFSLDLYAMHRIFDLRRNLSHCHQNIIHISRCSVW